MNMAKPIFPVDKHGELDIIMEDEDLAEKQEIENMWKSEQRIRDILNECLILEDEVKGDPNSNPPGPDGKDSFLDLRMELAANWDRQNIFAGVPEGLPQGGGISPVLSVQVLDRVFRDNPEAIMYADDGVIFDYPDFTGLDYPMNGIFINLEKSGWVKREGEWLKPLKFLGMKYDGRTNELWSETRKGKTIKIPVDKLERVLDDYQAYRGINQRKETNIWLRTFFSRISGLIQAIHYNGTFNLESRWNDWEIQTSKGSWLDLPQAKYKFLRNGVKPSLYNASTLASNWLANKLTQDRPSKAEDLCQGTSMNPVFPN